MKKLKRKSVSYRIQSSHAEMLETLSKHLGVSKTKLFELMIDALMSMSVKNTLTLPHECEILEQLYALRELSANLNINLENYKKRKGGELNNGLRC
tara:strand:- start:326 stop:613 length:288 start_codon:yes stop_codon:yes gene_type:complete